MARQLQQERRGGRHARPGPPTRLGPARSGTPSTPLHRAPAPGRHTGERLRSSVTGTRSRAAVLLVAAVAVAAAVALWLQDVRDPAADRPSALPRATPAQDTGASPTAAARVDQEPTPAPAAAPGPAGPPDASAAVQAVTNGDRTPAATRTALEQVLSARALATTGMLRAVVDGDLPTAATRAAEVDATSHDLEAVVGLWRDPALAAQLRAAFDAQTVASRAFATAVRDDDDAAANAARAEMGATSRVLGGMLEELSAGRITRLVPPEDAGQLRDLVEAHAAGDTATAAEVEAWLTARTGREGVALAAELAGPA